MLQEQVSEYLGVTSFKRKYPGIHITNEMLQVNMCTCFKKGTVEPRMNRG